MKKNKLTIAVACCLALCSCTRETAVPDAPAAIRVEMESKSQSSVTSGRQLMLFNSFGRLVWGGNAGSGAVIRARSGDGYTLVALDGCPDAFSDGTPTLESVMDLPVDLSGWNGPDGGFASCAVARGITLGAGETAVALELRRMACRVILRDVTLAPGSGLDGMVLENVFLSNVVSCFTPGGRGSGWANPMGRSGQPPAVSHIVDGRTFTADCPGQTFRPLNTVLHEGKTFNADSELYCYPNPGPSSVCGFGAVMTPRCTRLVAAVKYGNHSYYYPVDLPDLQGNCSCEVSLTLKNLGSGDPDLPLDASVLPATVTMSGWAFGNEFETNLSNQIKL